MKKILVPTDFSMPAQWALEVAVAIAQRAHGEIILLHVLEEPGADSFNAEGQVSDYNDSEERLFMAQLVRKCRRDLVEAASEVKMAGVEVTTRLRVGNAFHGIRSVIVDQDVDLVVMGASGRSKLEELFVGSNAERVIRYAKCPVLTVHERPLSVGFKNIVYASSLSEQEAAFSNVVKNAQIMYGSTIHLVHINTPTTFQPDSVVIPVMEKFAQSLGLENYTLNVFNHYSEEEGILEFSKRIKADLIAMSTHGRKGIAHVFSGSIAEDVANHATTPVLTYVTSKPG